MFGLWFGCGFRILCYGSIFVVGYKGFGKRQKDWMLEAGGEDEGQRSKEIGSGGIWAADLLLLGHAVLSGQWNCFPYWPQNIPWCFHASYWNFDWNYVSGYFWS